MNAHTLCSGPANVALLYGDLSGLEIEVPL
jgi:hypothetical protein